MHRGSLFAVLAAVSLLVVAAPVRAVVLPGSGPQDPGYAPGQLLVRVKPGWAPWIVHAETGANWRHTVPGIGVDLVELPPGTSVGDGMRRYHAHPGVAWAEPNFTAEAAAVPNDTLFSSQWGPIKVGAPAAWDLCIGTSAPIIAVVDTGVDFRHPDLAAKLLPGATFVPGTKDALDDNGHGTHVSGIAAAVANNVAGVAGMAWANAILPVKVLNADGVGTYDAIAEGMIYAADSGAAVINLSLGGLYDSQTLHDACDYAYTRGCVVVAATGNNDSTLIRYPAAYPTVIAVGATDQADAKATFSNYGQQLSVTAPGVGILSTMPTSPGTLNVSYGYATMYDSLSGTSMACPHVAGLAALLRSANPSLGPDGVRNVLQRTALDAGELGWDERFGYGRIRADAAVAEALWPSPPDPVAPSLAVMTPAAGDTLRGPALVTISAADNRAVARVEYAVDGVVRKVSGRQWTWQTGEDENGAHSLTVTVKDYDGNWCSQTVPVNVSNARTTDTFSGTLKTAYALHQFTTRLHGKVKAVLNWGKGAKLSLAILYSNGATAAYNSAGARPCALETILPAGNYLAKVGIMSGKASYTLSVTRL